MQFLLGIIVVAAGAVMVIKSEWLLRNFGRVNWAEIHLATSGGTRFFYKLLGVGIVIVVINGF